jgi:hypothetical protein
MTEHVEVLSAMSSGNQAMLLYDMHVQGLGTMRVAEHTGSRAACRVTAAMSLASGPPST